MCVSNSQIFMTKEDVKRFESFHLDWIEEATGGYWAFYERLKRSAPNRARELDFLLQNWCKAKLDFLALPINEDPFIHGIQRWAVRVLEDYEAGY